MSKEYNIEFLNRLNEEKKGCIINLINRFKDEIDEDSAIKEHNYTPHDMQHILDLYNIMNSFKVIGELNQTELLILSVATLFHDIGMHEYELNAFARATHTDMYVKRIDGYMSDVVYTNNIEAEYAEFIKTIGYYHSDSKNGQSNVSISPFNELKDYKLKTSGELIRVRLLSAILRLADELDICTVRLGKHKIPSIENVGEDENKIFSRERWLQLKYFRMCSVKENTINLEIVEGVCFSNDSINEKTGCRLLNEHLLKVRETLKGAEGGQEIFPSINSIFANYGMPQYTVEIISNKYSEETIQQILSNDQNEFDDEVHDDSTKRKINTANDEFKLITVLDQVANENISKFVYDNELIEFGHFSYNNSKYCSREYINTSKMLQEFGKFDEYSNYFINAIKADNKNKKIIIGINPLGFLIASSIGFKLKVPFYSYFSISKNSSRSYVEKNDLEKIGKSIMASDSVYFVTDCITTLETISNAIKKFKSELSNKKIEVLSIFYKKSMNLGNNDIVYVYESLLNGNNSQEDYVLQMLKNKNIKISILCDKFSGELFTEAECKYNPKFCK